jgi:hypothetical protein
LENETPRENGKIQSDRFGRTRSFRGIKKCVKPAWIFLEGNVSNATVPVELRIRIFNGLKLIGLIKKRVH